MGATEVRMRESTEGAFIALSIFFFGLFYTIPANICVLKNVKKEIL
jgi:hypothetical protein